MDDYSDSCLFFTTTYHIKVDTVLHSYFPLKKDDILILKTNLFGYGGGCYTDSMRMGAYHSTSHSTRYQLSDVSYFFIDRSSYIRQYLEIIQKTNKYQDKFCNNSFRMKNDNGELSRLMEEADNNNLSKLINLINK